MTKAIRSIRGIHDILPEESKLWQFIEDTARKVFERFGYSELRIPVIEKTELFTRSIGESTDIVEKEMYTFRDRKGESITLRPEATAGIVRAYIENSIGEREPVSRFYFIGPMFRYERPQKGRYRQFHQIDAEVLGDPGPAVDAELIFMANLYFQELGMNGLKVHINSLGCPRCRKGYREELRSYLEKVSESLCEDCRRRSRTNPLRFFDCKVESCRRLVPDAPKVLDFLDDDCRNHFERVKNLLKDMKIDCVVDPFMVRGIDYYTRTVFEIVTDRLDAAQNAVCGGGRYDSLVGQLGGKPTPAIGFAMGMERIVVLLEGRKSEFDYRPEVFLAYVGDETFGKAFELANRLRMIGVKAVMSYDRPSLKSQMRRANKCGAPWTVIIHPDDMAKGCFVLKNMSEKTEEKLAWESSTSRIYKIVKGEEP